MTTERYGPDSVLERQGRSGEAAADWEFADGEAPAATDAVPRAHLTEDEAARIRRFHRIGHRGVLVTLVVALAMAPALSGHLPGRWLLAWLTAVVAVGGIRLALFAWVRRRPPPRDALRTWGWVAAALSFLQGAAWLPLLWFAVTVGTWPVTLLAGLTFGLFATGIVSIVGLYPPVYWAYVLPLMGGAVYWLVRHPESDPATAAAFVLLAGLMLRGAAHSSRQLRSSIARRRETEDLAARLAVEKRRFQSTLASIDDAVITTGRNGAIAYMNAAAERLTGWSGSEAAGRHLSAVVVLAEDAPDASLAGLMETCLTRGAPVHREGDVRMRVRGGTKEYLAQISLAPMQDEPGPPDGLVAVIRDVTELRGMARQVQVQGRVDALTGLANRQAFQEVLRGALGADAPRRAGLAVCWLDLDRFKLVNDAGGHLAGDAMLCQVAELMRSRLPEDATLARMGGDEFALLLNDCTLDEAARIVAGVRDQIAQFRFAWAERVFNPGLSAGIVPAHPGDSAGAVLAAADAACYLAKEEGVNSVRVAGPDDVALASRHGEAEWASRVRVALDEHRFRLRYQRLEPLQPDLPAKVEFLLTLLDDDGGLTGPARFLPAAERFNMMPALDRHVVRLALQVIGERPRELADVEQFAINLSGQSLNDPAFLDFVLEAITETGTDPDRLCFEITETAVISNMARARAFITTLREHGCRFALDDFGSGLSSFGYLRALPVDYLKIDGQFVRNIAADQADQSMVRCVNQVGHTMGILTVAECVEDAAALERVRALGVDYAQGYAVHRPALLS